MSAMIEKHDTVFSTNALGGVFAKMWHGLETVIESITFEAIASITSACPIRECGVQPVMPELANLPQELAEEMKKWKLIFADCRNGKAKTFLPLCIPKEGYLIHQYSEFAETFVKAGELAFGKDKLELVSAGTLDNFKHFFMSAVIKGEEEFSMGKLPNGALDKHVQFLGFNTASDCTVSSQFDYCGTRRVCMNTVRMSVAETEESGNRLVLKHTKKSLDGFNADTLAKYMSNWVTSAQAFQKVLKELKKTSMDVDTFRFFASGMFSMETSKELSTNSFNRVNDLIPLFQRGEEQGNRGESRYDAFNAVTEYMTHHALSDKVERSKRIAYASTGRGNDWKKEALDILTNEDLLTQALKRGERLYTDKALVVSQSN